MAALGHDFTNPDHLQQALTHASLADRLGRDAANERLEFLGDRVLGLVVADMLLTAFPGENEGQIARRHSALVRRDALARVARHIGLGAYLNLSTGEEEGGGRENPAIIADCCEAVIAALYLDGGLSVARAFIEREWTGMLGEEPTPPKDAKTALQEWAQAHGLPLPVYTEVSREGPAHAPLFQVEVSVEGHPPAKAEGTTKRAAEQDAAATLLGLLSNDDG